MYSIFPLLALDAASAPIIIGAFFLLPAIAIALVVTAVVLIVRAVKNRKK